MDRMQEGVRKRVLITGASEGIGRAFTMKLASLGCEVTGIARNEAGLKEVEERIKERGGRFQWITADLTELGDLKRVTDELSKNEPYSLLVNNAGVGSVGDFASTPIDSHRKLIELNVWAPLALTHAFLERAKSGDGIIQVSSALSFTPLPAQPVYSATKAFLTSFSESLWFQCGKKGIQVFNICPGITRTGFTSRAGGDSSAFPDELVESPEQVVDYALKEFFKGAGPTRISGWRNRMGVFLTRLKSRKSVVESMGRFSS
jgi:short-subunit dehydrogenase